MEEVKKIESVNSYKSLVTKMCVVSLIIAIVGFVVVYITNSITEYYGRQLDSLWGTGEEWFALFEEIEPKRNIAKALYYIGGYCGIGFIIVFVVLVIFYLYVNKMQLVVTDKRVYGKTAFGKQVDLPIDSISAVGTSMLKGITVATSSGKIKFLGISNRDDIHKVISQLLIERQNNKKEATAVTHVTQQTQSSADELKKYKDLLDSGVISQEEFDAKKKQLLDL